MSTTGPFDIERISSLFVYDPKAPMVFNSGTFLLLFLGFFGIYILLHNKKVLRIAFTVLFSLFFYYKSSGFYFWVLILSTLIDYHLGNAIYKETRNGMRRFYLVLSLVSNLGILAYFKYSNFGIRNLNALLDLNLQELDIFLPVGISFYTFQTLSYSIDIYRRQLEPARNILDFAFFVSFFPQLVAGPIVRAADFIPQIYEKVSLKRIEMSRAFYLICGGLFKKVVISDYLSVNFVDRVFENPMLYSAFENWLGMYGYAVQIYCDFSGYSDMAIGLSLLLGFRLPDNFNSPYQSASITEFWRRWHISLSSWLRDYLYISLGGNRKGKLRTYVNLMLTMLIGGLWHGASWKFVVWGAMHGITLALEKVWFLFFPRNNNPIRKVFGWFLTFHIVCFAWIFFRAGSFEIAGRVLQRMFEPVRGLDMAVVIDSYRLIISLILLAFLLHFIPKNWENSFIRFFDRWPLLLKALYVSVSIWIVVQVAQAEVQPFIYFQF